jgi:hypothetical protein
VKSMLRWVQGIVLVGGVAGTALVLWLSSSSTWSADVNNAKPAVEHTYPVPSFPPYTPAHYSAQPADPQTTVLPCPPGEVATTAQWHGQTVLACTIPGGVPANPGTGPMCAGANGGPPYPPIKEPDGSYGC